MGWYALEEIQNALDDTKELLLPFNWKTWAKIAFIAVFLGGSGLSNIPTPSGNYQEGGGETGTSYSAPMESFSQGQFVPEAITGMATGTGQTAILLAALAIVVPLVLVLMLIGSVFKFVFYQSLMDKDVQIRKNVDRHFGKGLRFLGANLVILFFMLLGLGAMTLMFVASPVVGALALIAALPVLILVGFALRLFNDFVPLKMMDEDSGVVEAVREFSNDVRKEWKQLAVYILVSIGLGIGVGLFSIMGMMVIGLLVLIPFAITGYLASLVAEALLAVVVIAGVLLWFGLVLYFVSGPVTTFIHYYVIRVYHRVTA